jgi:opacity protein-like surface antigen
MAHTEFDEGRFATLFGGGLEYAFNKHWSAKLEYNFADYDTKIIRGDRTQTEVKGGTFVEHEQYQSNLYLHTLELGLDYRF